MSWTPARKSRSSRIQVRATLRPAGGCTLAGDVPGSPTFLPGSNLGLAGGADPAQTQPTSVARSASHAGDVAIFDREGASFAVAVGSALADLVRALPHAQVLRVEPAALAGGLSVAS